MPYRCLYLSCAVCHNISAVHTIGRGTNRRLCVIDSIINCYCTILYIIVCSGIYAFSLQALASSSTRSQLKSYLICSCESCIVLADCIFNVLFKVGASGFYYIQKMNARPKESLCFALSTLFKVRVDLWCIIYNKGDYNFHLWDIIIILNYYTLIY